MSLSQVVAHEMVNKCVKFHNISFNSVEAMIKNKKISKSEKGHNFVNIQDRVMSLGQIIALVMVNKCVKF